MRLQMSVNLLEIGPKTTTQQRLLPIWGLKHGLPSHPLTPIPKSL